MVFERCIKPAKIDCKKLSKRCSHDHWNNLDLNQILTEKNRSAVLRAPPHSAPSFPMIGIEYFGVKQAIMWSETSLQNHPDLDQSKTQ